MPIVITHQGGGTSGYKDIPFERYHFPKKAYGKFIRPGEIFVYYRSEQHANALSNSRFYFGCGLIDSVWADPESDEHAYASLSNVREFKNRVLLRKPEGGYYESIDYSQVRKKERPPFPSAVRALSGAALAEILAVANIPESVEDFRESSQMLLRSPWEVVQALNDKYASERSRGKRQKLVESYLDRGMAVTRALKGLLGDRCQMCGIEGFLKPDGTRYVEAHHIEQISTQSPGVLCSDNVVLVCPTCHRKLHYGVIEGISSTAETITIIFRGEPAVVIRRNSLSLLKGPA